MKQTIDFVKIKATLSVQIERLPNDQLPTVINRKTLCNALRLYRDFENLFYNHQQIANAIHATNNAVHRVVSAAGDIGENAEFETYYLTSLCSLIAKNNIYTR